MQKELKKNVIKKIRSEHFSSNQGIRNFSVTSFSLLAHGRKLVVPKTKLTYIFCFVSLNRLSLYLFW